MKRKSQRGGRDWRSLSSQRGAEDGVDPRQFFDRRQDHKPHRKTLQLCGQVRRVLDYVLSGDCDDDLLRGLMVHDVRPAPDASRLLVTVVPLDPELLAKRDQILQRLAWLSPRLRSEVARTINRRKTPVLMFQVADPNSLAEEETPPPVASPEDE